MEREFTATCYIIKDEKALLVHHKKLNKWMPPGGHLDPGETPQEAVIRECFEETGLHIELISDEEPISYPNARSLTRPYLCLLENIPQTPQSLAHQHIDFVFIGKPIGGHLLCNATESHDLRWFTHDDIARLLPEVEIFAEVRDTLFQLFAIPSITFSSKSTNDACLQAYELGFEAYLERTVAEVSGDVKTWIDNTLARLSRTASIIEIGSGHGRDAHYIQSKGFTITPTDATRAFVSLLQQKGYPATLFNVLADTFASQYDLVFANAVFLHLRREEFERVLRKIHLEGLVPQGYLSFSLKLGEGEKWTREKIDQPRYFCYWQEEPLKKLLTSTGFCLVSLQKSQDQKWLQVIAQRNAW